MRKGSFCRELYIEAGGFHDRASEEVFPPLPGNEVRLMHAYFVKCEGYEKDENGTATVVHATYDPERLNADPDLPDPEGKGHDPLGGRALCKAGL